MRIANKFIAAATIASLIPAAGAAVSQTTGTLPRALRAAPDPIVARINGTRAPNMLIGVGLDHADPVSFYTGSPLVLSRSELSIGLNGAHGTLRLGGLGPNGYDASFVRYFLNVERPTFGVSVPLDSAGATLSFLPSAAPAASFFVAFQMPDADVYTSVTLTSGVVPGQFLAGIPGVDEYEMQEIIMVHAHGISGAGTFRVESQSQPNNAPPRMVLVAESFVVQAGSIEVSDLIGVTRFTEAFLKTFDELFGTTGASDVQAAMTLLVNAALNDESTLKPFITAQLNAVMAGAAPIAGYSATVPCTDVMQISLQATLASASSSTAQLTTSFNVGTAPAGPIVNPTLPYRLRSRPVEDPARVEMRGDVQVLAPLSLVDELGFNVAVMGLFNQGLQVTLPEQPRSPLPAPFSPPALPRYLAISVAPTGGPVTDVDPARPGELQWSIPMRLNAGAAPGSATLRVGLRPQISARGALQLRLTQAELRDVTGNASVAGLTFPLSTFATQLNALLLEAFRRSEPVLTVVPKLTDPQTGVVTSIADLRVTRSSIQVAISFDRPAPPPDLMMLPGH